MIPVGIKHTMAASIPKAARPIVFESSFRVLSAAGIKIYTTDAKTVTEALAQYRAGKLNAANAADVGGHWA